MPLRSPEPWVAVAIEPPTEMCGSEAMLARAKPAPVERLGEVAILDAAADGNGAGGGVDFEIVAGRGC